MEFAWKPTPLESRVQPAGTPVAGAAATAAGGNDANAGQSTISIQRGVTGAPAAGVAPAATPPAAGAPPATPGQP